MDVRTGRDVLVVGFGFQFYKIDCLNGYYEREYYCE
jgi:hypothetical protein